MAILIHLSTLGSLQLHPYRRSYYKIDGGMSIVIAVTRGPVLARVMTAIEER